MTVGIFSDRGSFRNQFGRDKRYTSHVTILARHRHYWLFGNAVGDRKTVARLSQITIIIIASDGASRRGIQPSTGPDAPSPGPFLLSAPYILKPRRAFAGVAQPCSARQIVASPQSYSRASAAMVSPAEYRSASRLR
jgi:hypothetical protein